MHTAHSGAFAHPHRNVSAFGIEHGMKVADFGSGSGAYVFAVAEALSGSGTVYAIDVQRDLLRRIKNEAAHRNFHNVDVIWSDLEKQGGSKLKKSSIDIVLISNLLFQLADKKTPLLEAAHILKHDGTLVIIDWSDPALSKQKTGRVGPAKDAAVTKEQAIQCAESAGFSLAKEFSAGAHHYGLILSRTTRKKSPRKLVVH